MIQKEYVSFAGELAKKAGVENGLHGYFLQHRDRLWQTASHFDLWQVRDQKVLEIGPFFSYTPFVFKKQGNEVDVLEGEDPAVYPLKPVYEAQGIRFSTCDFVETFGAAQKEKHVLPYPENQFDLVSCWENMEHFNFNPVGFVLDLYRVLKPGGRAFITVPNNAKFGNRIRLLCGKSIATSIHDYEQYYNYANSRFMGFHWREYVLAELTQLLRTHRFEVIFAGHLFTMQNYQSPSAAVKLRRLVLKSAHLLVPSMGNICAVVVQKPL